MSRWKRRAPSRSSSPSASVLTRWITPDAPGCAVGIYEAGRVVHTRGYVLANVEHGTPITIRHLLNQTSGLRDFHPGALVRLAGGLPRDVVSTQRSLDFLSRQRSLDFPTGSRFAYGNVNFTVAGEIVRRVNWQVRGLEANLLPGTVGVMFDWRPD